MAIASARVPVLMTDNEKARIVKKAERAGISTGEFMRRAAQDFSPSEDEKLLEGMIDQMLKATAEAEKAIDDALDFIAASNLRIARMEAAR